MFPNSKLDIGGPGFFFLIWFLGFSKKIFLVFPNEISLVFIVYFCTRYDFFRVLKKNSFQLKYIHTTVHSCALKSKNELWKTLLNHCRAVLWFLRQTARQRLRGRLLQPRYRCELAPGRCLLDLFVLFGPVGLDHGLVFGWINYRKSCLWSPTPSWGIWNFPSFRQEIHSAFYSKTITKEFLITSWWNSLTTFYLKCKCYLWNSFFLKFWVDVIWYYVPAKSISKRGVLKIH